MSWSCSDRLHMCLIENQPNCIIDCRNMPDGAYSFCGDCRKFVTCTGEHANINTCPNKQYWGFDQATKKCQYKSPDCFDCSGILQIVPFCGTKNSFQCAIVYAHTRKYTRKEACKRVCTHGHLSVRTVTRIHTKPARQS